MNVTEAIEYIEGQLSRRVWRNERGVEALRVLIDVARPLVECPSCGLSGGFHAYRWCTRGSDEEDPVWYCKTHEQLARDVDECLDSEIDSDAWGGCRIESRLLVIPPYDEIIT